MMENKETTRKIEDEKAQGMGRGTFLASLFGTPVAAKALDLPARPDGKPALLAFETPEHLSPDTVKRIREQIDAYARRHNFEFMVLQGGMTVKQVS